jgi:hypothetical protein
MFALEMGNSLGGSVVIFISQEVGGYVLRDIQERIPYGIEFPDTGDDSGDDVEIATKH